MGDWEWGDVWDVLTTPEGWFIGAASAADLASNLGTFGNTGTPASAAAVELLLGGGVADVAHAAVASSGPAATAAAATNAAAFAGQASAKAKKAVEDLKNAADWVPLVVVAIAVVAVAVYLAPAFIIAAGRR